MVYRPQDWAPLAAADPVPGRPGDVRDEAGRLKAVSDSIHDQVAALNRVARADDEHDLRGQFAGKIKDTARSLADHLGRARERYRVVSGELSAWADELEAAQRDSVSRHDDAVTAQRDIDAYTPHPVQATSATPSAHPSAAASGASDSPPPDPTQQHLLADAQRRLADARAALGRTVSQLQDQAKRHAGAIRDVIKHDGMKDSRWDKFKHWVDDHSYIISMACNALGWIATGCAVLALFVPGVNVAALAFLTGVAIGGTGLSLVGHGMLAAAGDGSWFDVGVDAFALVTFGLGRAAGTAAKEGETTVRVTLQGAGARALSKAVDADAGLQKAYGVVDATDGSVSAAEKAKTWQDILPGFADADAAAQAARDTARKASTFKVPEPPKIEWPKGSTLWNGDRDIAFKRPWAQGIATMLAGDKVAGQAADLDKNLRSVGNWWRAATGVDLLDKAFGSVAPFAGWQGYSNVTRHPFTMPIGSAW